MEKFDYEKLYSRIFKIVLIVFVVTFVTLYFSQITGYYEYEQHKKVALTEEQIKKFEQDVKDGKNIDIEDYLTNKEYQNKISQAGLYISEKIGSGAQAALKYTFSALNRLIDSG